MYSRANPPEAYQSQGWTVVRSYHMSWFVAPGPAWRLPGVLIVDVAEMAPETARLFSTLTAPARPFRYSSLSRRRLPSAAVMKFPVMAVSGVTYGIG